jgi:hypothetical protein
MLLIAKRPYDSSMGRDHHRSAYYTASRYDIRSHHMGSRQARLDYNLVNISHL